MFKRLSDEIPLEVKVISGKAPTLHGINLNFIPWTLEGQNSEIATFDIGVMPLPDSPYARGKCAYKALQYMAAGVVPVVSDVGVNSEVVQDGENGFVASDVEDFYHKIKLLYNNKEMLKKMGAESSLRTKEYYSVDTAVARLDEIFRLKL